MSQAANVPVSNLGPDDVHERQIQALLEEFLRQRRAGRCPDPYDVMQAHPHLAAELEPRLEAIDRLLSLGPLLGETVSLDSGSERLAASGPIPLPAMIGCYEIREKLGTGASATVYRAFDPRLRREVALKVLHPDQEINPHFEERFARDARFAAAMRHAHIVEIFEIGQHEGRPFIALELVHGQTLEERIKQSPDKPLDFRESAEIVRLIASALDHAHRRGFVHRDVKPSNILLDDRGEPHLTDFGLARKLEGEKSLTVQGQILGTPAYLSPEQAGGHSKEVDGRSDVYALGVILFRLLTGGLPFSEDSLESLLLQKLANEAPWPRRLNPAVPRDLDTICHKALEKLPGDRFATAGDMADELWRWLKGEALTIRRPTAWEYLRRWTRRNQLTTWIASAAALILLVVGCTLGAMVLNERQNTQNERIRTTIESRARAEVDVRRKLEEARTRMHNPTRGRRTEAQNILLECRVARGQIVDEALKQELDLELRSVYAATLGLPDLEEKEVAALPTKSFHHWSLAMRPDGTAMAIGTRGGPILWKRGHKPPKVEEQDPKPPAPRLWFSPNGQYLAFAPTNGGLELWDGELKKCLGIWTDKDRSPVLAVGFGPDGKSLWACTEDGKVGSLQVPSLAVDTRSWQAGRLPKRINVASFNPDTSRLAVSGDDGPVKIITMDAKTPARELPLPHITVQALAWSPDGELLAVGAKEGSVSVWPATERGLPGLPLSYGNPVSSLVFHPNGRWLLAAGVFSGMKMWDTTTGELLLTGLTAACSFSNDGRTYAGASRNSAVFCDLASPSSIRSFAAQQTSVEQIAWSRDPRYLVCLDSKYEVKVWDVMNGHVVDEFTAPEPEQVPGDEFYAGNAAVAISDNASQVVYASGGASDANVYVRDVKNKRRLGEWPLGKGGYEKLACRGGNSFVLVREEKEDRKEFAGQDRAWPVHTVVYELTEGRPPSQSREIRASREGDFRRFYFHGLSADGRYYWWTGPREGTRNHRVELIEVASGESVLPKPLPAWDANAEFAANLSSDGRYFWFSEADGEYYRSDLSNACAKEKVAWLPLEASELAGFALDYSRVGRDRDKGIVIRRLEHAGAWLKFSQFDRADIKAARFSIDGRHLAWGSGTGLITVTDLQKLRDEVAAFERRFQDE